MKKYSVRHVRRLAKSAVECNSLINVGESRNSSFDLGSQEIVFPHSTEDRHEDIVTEQDQDGVEIVSVQTKSLNPDQLFAEKLIQWKEEEGITLQALSKLLKILKSRPDLNFLPSDARTILKTPRATALKKVHPGDYHHFGLKEAITDVLTKVEFDSSIPIYFDLNVDGLPLTKSSGSQLWPIQGALVGFSLPPFIIGIYHGFSKPSSSVEFLRDFVDDYKQVLKEGIQFRGARLCVKLRCIVCDAPAKAFVLNTVSHNSYFGCGRCTQKGTYYKRRVVFHYERKQSRIDSEFERKSYRNHQNGRSALAGLEIGLVSQSVLDYMHVVGLGVMRRLLNLWTHGKRKCRISSRLIIAISSHLLKIKPFIPTEFSRKPRPLSEFGRWKFTELRTFLLYTSVVVLKHRLEEKYYLHYLSLFVAIFILATPAVADSLLKYAEELLEYFVRHFQKLYGFEFLSYNVHALLHLVEDVRKFGHLDSYAATKFENNMQTMKGMVQGNQKPLQQIVRRMKEEKSKTPAVEPAETVPKYQLLVQHKNGPTIGTNDYIQFKKFKCKDFALGMQTCDSYFQCRSGKLGQVLNCLSTPSGIKLLVQFFSEQKDFFTRPCASSVLGIYKVDTAKHSAPKLLEIKNIFRKYVAIPYTGSCFVFTPLIHC